MLILFWKTSGGNEQFGRVLCFLRKLARARGLLVFTAPAVISFPSLYISEMGRVWLSPSRGALHQERNSFCDQKNTSQTIA